MTTKRIAQISRRHFLASTTVAAVAVCLTPRRLFPELQPRKNKLNQLKQVLQTIHGRAATVDLQLMRTLKNSAKGQKGQFQSSSAPTHPAPLILDLVRRNQLPLTTERLRKLAGDNVPGTAKTNTVAERRRKKSTHPFAALRNLPSGSAWPFDLGLWTLDFGLQPASHCHSTGASRIKPHQPGG
jgi:hypothetical protein